MYNEIHRRRMDHYSIYTYLLLFAMEIAQVRGGAEDECNNNDNLRVQWDLTGFYHIVFDVRHVMQ